MEAIDPALRLRAATQALPTPPELPTSSSTTEEDPLDEPPTRRWALVAAGAAGTGLLAVLTAILLVKDPEPERTPAVASASEDPAPQRQDVRPRVERDEEPTPPLVIPDPPSEAAQHPASAPTPFPPKAEELPHPEIEPDPEPEPEPEPDSTLEDKASAGTSKLTLRAGFSRAEVQIRGKTITLSSTKTLKVRAGSVKVRWRFPPSQTWSQKQLQLKQGRSYVVQVEKSGLRVQEGRG